MHPKSDEAKLSAAGMTDADGVGQTPSSGKRVWRTPAVEEVPFTRTEAGGSGAVYDFVVYSGSA